MTLTTTNRGFRRLEFTDFDGGKCHLQESSLATEPCIRFGHSESGIIHLAPGKGWQPVAELPKNTMCNSTMHLNQEQVAHLMPYLLEFMLFGTVGDIDGETEATNRLTAALRQATK